MEKKLITLRENRKRRKLIINSCSLFNIALFVFLIFNLFFSFITGTYFFIGTIILFLASNFIIHKQKKDDRKEKKIVLEEVVSMRQNLEPLLELLAGKYEDFQSLDETRFNSEDDLQKEYLKYAEFVFCDVLNKMVEITGVAPDPILLPMNTKKHVEQLFSMATAMVTSTLGILHRTERELKW